VAGRRLDQVADNVLRGAGGEGRGELALASEPTEAGEQVLVPGVRPIRLRDRLAFLAEAPLQPKKLQRPADFGLFDINVRNQLDLFSKPPANSRKQEQIP
jgi:hypothetical protein